MTDAGDILGGLRLPPELLAGDLSRVNEASARAGMATFRRALDGVRVSLETVVVPALSGLWFIASDVAERMTRGGRSERWLARRARQFYRQRRKRRHGRAGQWPPPAHVLYGRVLAGGRP